MKLAGLAKRIKEYLGDTAVTCWGGESFVYIRFEGEAAEERIGEENATDYLAWLESGKVGTYFDWVIEMSLAEDATAQAGEYDHLIKPAQGNPPAGQAIQAVDEIAKEQPAATGSWDWNRPPGFAEKRPKRHGRRSR